MAYEEFHQAVEKAAEEFSKIEDTIRVVSHFDADGICAGSIMASVLKTLGKRFSLSTVKQLSEDVLIKLSHEQYKVFVFADLGSGQYDFIKKHLPGKKIFILDHHSFEDSLIEDKDNITMLNPHSFGIDGSNDISGAGVTYLFAEALDENSKNIAHLAILGALGDLQEKDGFSSINNRILETAVQRGKIKTEKGLKWFGIETKPLYKLLAYNTDFIIPNVTGSESSTIQFLKDMGIEPKNEKGWTKFNDLNEDQKKNLIAAILMKRSNEGSPEDILGIRYLLCDEPESSPSRDGREFATLLNACGRMDKASYGIGTCLNDAASKEKALSIMDLYKREIINALNWYNNNKASGNMIKGKDYLIINASNNISPTIIGTLASIISKSGDLEKGTKILSLAENNDGTTKVSLRIVGEYEDIDLRETINKITSKIAGESGGHKNAAGAIIQSSRSKEFIEEAKKIFEE